MAMYCLVNCSYTTFTSFVISSPSCSFFRGVSRSRLCAFLVIGCSNTAHQLPILGDTVYGIPTQAPLFHINAPTLLCLLYIPSSTTSIGIFSVCCLRGPKETLFHGNTLETKDNLVIPSWGRSVRILSGCCPRGPM